MVTKEAMSCRETYGMINHVIYFHIVGRICSLKFGPFFPCGILKYTLKPFITCAVQGTGTGTKKTMLCQIQQPDQCSVIISYVIISLFLQYCLVVVGLVVDKSEEDVE